MSARVGCTTKSLGRWENGVCEPGFDTVGELAEIYGVSLDWLNGRTPVQLVLRPGQVLVDEGALAALKELVEKGKSLDDLPETLVRRPGVACAFVVPERVLLLGNDAASAIEAELQQMIMKLRTKRR